MLFDKTSTRTTVPRILGIVVIVSILLSFVAAIRFVHILISERREVEVLAYQGYRFFYGSGPQRAEDALWYSRVTQVYCPNKNLDSSLFKLGNFPFLETIQFAKCQFSDNRLEFLTKLLRLRTLMIFDTPLNDVGATYVSFCKNLTELQISRTKMSDKGLAKIAQLPKLVTLELNDTEIEGKLPFRLESTKLRTVGVTRSRVGDEFVRQIAECKNVESLDLSGTNITNQSVRYLATMPHLEDLSIQNTAVDDNALNDIQQMKSLQQINVTGTKISSEGLSWLDKACPQLDVIDWEGRAPVRGDCQAEPDGFVPIP